MKKTYFLIAWCMAMICLHAQNNPAHLSKKGDATISYEYDHEAHENQPFNAPKYRNCGAMEAHQEMLKTYPEYANNLAQIEAFTQEYIKNYQSTAKTVESIITIPVVFHVVYKNATENVSDLRIMEQIDVLNQDFSKTNADTGLVPAIWKPLHEDTGIRFCLAKVDPYGNPTTGITRTKTTMPLFVISGNSVKFTSAGGKDAWNTSKYLNIWVCDLGTSLLGYGQFPGGNPATDGVVLNYRIVGKTGSMAPYNKGRTGTHEVGHYLNLFHVWGDVEGCTTDDNIDDTPVQDDKSFGCFTFPKTDICQPNPPGIMFMNYMDYSNDGCSLMFTRQQKLRMRAALAGYRGGLDISTACSGTGANPTSCHTLYYPFPGVPTLYKVNRTGQSGYIGGTNSYKDQSKTNYFTDYPPAYDQVRGVVFKFARAHYTDGSHAVNVRIWSENTTTKKPNPTPLHSVPLSMETIKNDVNAGQYTVVNFDSPISISSSFFAGISFEMSGNNYAYPNDTVALYSSQNNYIKPGIAWEQFADGNWYPFTDGSSWSMNLALGIMPIICPSVVSVENTIEDNSHNLQVFPNPNDGTFDIIYPLQSKNAVLSVYNMLGQEVFTENIPQNTDLVYQKHITLNNPAKGLYLVRITDGNFVSVKKVQIQ